MARRTSRRIGVLGVFCGAAVVVLAGALSIGAAASSSGSGSKRSASSVKRGPFSTRGTHLEVINTDLGVPSSYTITVTICAVNVRCKAPETIGRGQSVEMAAGRVDGHIRYPNGYTFRFEAFNPAVGEPWVAVTDAQGNKLYCQGGYGNIYEPQGNGTSCKLKLSEGQRRNVNAPAGRRGHPGYVLSAKRTADSRHYKMMSLTTDPCYVDFGRGVSCK